VEENIFLSNPKTAKLEVKSAKLTKYYNNDWFRIKPFAGLNDDTVFVRNVSIRIVQSTNDSFNVKLVKLSNGYSRQNANVLADKIPYNITQSDSSLLLDKGIALNTTDKFRNQHVIVTIAVPVGKRILIRENAGWSDDININFGRNNRNNEDWNEDDTEEYRWSRNVEYMMTDKGLKRTDKTKEENNTDNTREEKMKGDTVRYHYQKM
jgi:hypothetical protein